MNEISCFLWGFAGSAAVEVVSIANFYETGRRLPARYTKIAFYVVRLMLATVAGGLAVAYEIQDPLLAVHVGAATPLILQSLARTSPLSKHGERIGEETIG